jgi:hypothetical protein
MALPRPGMTRPLDGMLMLGAHCQVLELHKQQEITKQTEAKAKEAEMRKDAAAISKVRGRAAGSPAASTAPAAGLQSSIWCRQPCTAQGCCFRLCAIPFTCNTTLALALLCCAVLCCAVLCCDVLCCAVSPAQAWLGQQLPSSNPCRVAVSTCSVTPLQLCCISTSSPPPPQQPPRCNRTRNHCCCCCCCCSPPCPQPAACRGTPDCCWVLGAGTDC